MNDEQKEKLLADLKLKYETESMEAWTHVYSVTLPKTDYTWLMTCECIVWEIEVHDNKILQQFEKVLVFCTDKRKSPIYAEMTVCKPWEKDGVKMYHVVLRITEAPEMVKIKSKYSSFRQYTLKNPEAFKLLNPGKEMPKPKPKVSVKPVVKEVEKEKEKPKKVENKEEKIKTPEQPKKISLAERLRRKSRGN